MNVSVCVPDSGQGPALRGALIPAQRRAHIRTLLESGGIVRVDALSRELGVSEATVRRDLDALERDGLLERTHGGAYNTRGFGPEPLYSEKRLRCAEEKRRIGRLTASLVRDGQTILLNGGTTTLEVACAIAGREDLHDVRLVTVNLHIPAEIHEERRLEIVLLGGLYRPQSHALVGPLALAGLEQFAADMVILGVDGIHARFGITCPNPLEAAVARGMIDRTHGDVVVVADHTKLDAVAGAVCAPLERVTRFVTDAGADGERLSEFRQRGLEVLVA